MASVVLRPCLLPQNAVSVILSLGSHVQLAGYNILFRFLEHVMLYEQRLTRA